MKKWLLVLSIIVTFTGCSSTKPTGLSVDGRFHQVIFGNGLIASIISVEDVKSTNVNGHTQAIVTVSNSVSADIDIQFRFHWYNNNGLEVNLRPSEWKKQRINGNDKVSLSEVSLSPKGKEFRIQIREYYN